MELMERMARRQLVVVTGKGGVGKTVVSATLGRALAAAGRRTLVVEVDPRENLHQMMGTPPSGGDVVAAGPRPWVPNVKPRQGPDPGVRDQPRAGLVHPRGAGRPLHDRVRRDPELLVVNGLYPPAPPEPPPPAGETSENELISLWRRRRRLNDRELARLKESWPGPRIELPQLPLDRGLALLGTLG